MAWCKFPSRWIKDGRLAELRWHPYGSDATAALLLLMAIAVGINEQTIRNLRETDELDVAAPIAPDVRLTYDRLMEMTGISRPKVAAGLALLKEFSLIEVVIEGRNARYAIPDLRVPGNWCPFPQLQVYRKGVFQEFLSFRLREKWELQALALYVVLLTFMTNNTDTTALSYTKIEEYTGMRREEISRAIDHLINLYLVSLQPADSASLTIVYTSNVYKMLGFRPRRARVTSSA